MFDLVILTDKRYLKDNLDNTYHHNVFLEDKLLLDALTNKGLNVTRTNWDNPNFNWNETKYALFRTTWDYFDRFDEFFNWFEVTKSKTNFIHHPEIIKWNIDKHYFKDLNKWGIPTIETFYIKKNSGESLKNYTHHHSIVLKPCISGAGKDTYKIDLEDYKLHESLFNELLSKQDMMIQPFQKNIDLGEISFMFFGNHFSHATLKKAKKGDFRVQDDFGGTVEVYSPKNEELNFAKQVVSKLQIDQLVYARVDVIRNNEDELVISELELIEPEIWLRLNTKAPNLFAEAINTYIIKQNDTHEI